MGFSKEEGEALNSAVRGIVERAISSLQAVGMARQDALSLLVVQSSIRMDQATMRKAMQWLVAEEARNVEDDGG
jgi:hypothetical protein